MPITPPESFYPIANPFNARRLSAEEDTPCIPKVTASQLFNKNEQSPTSSSTSSFSPREKAPSTSRFYDEKPRVSPNDGIGEKKKRR